LDYLVKVHNDVMAVGVAPDKWSMFFNARKIMEQAAPQLIWNDEDPEEKQEQTNKQVKELQGDHPLAGRLAYALGLDLLNKKKTKVNSALYVSDTYVG
jgi:hypothetical protein